MLPAAFIDKLREHINLVDLISQKVKLTRRSREWVGLCPFHSENTPSFTVFHAKTEDRFYCFGCQQSGDLITWVELTRNVEFYEAVEILAELGGLEMPRRTPQEQAQHVRERDLYDVIEGAAQWFTRRLVSGTPAWAYLQGRGIAESTFRAFRLGWAPNDAQELRRAFHGGGDELLIEAGLIRKPDSGGEPFAFFRNRLMFPITDRRGRVIAFSARTLSDAVQPKYLNSPETLLFSKRQSLYGIASARAASLEKPAPTDGAARGFAEAILVVEGPMDVISLDQVGLPAVATLGTAVTEEHLHVLWQTWAEPICCFDGDAAGATAAKRVLKLALPLLQPDRSLFFARLPAGEDPDSLIRSQGRPAIDRVISGALPLSRFLFQIEAALHSNDTPERAAGLRERLERDCGAIQNDTVRAEYRRYFSRVLAAPVLSSIPSSDLPDDFRPRLEALFRLIAAAPDLIEDLAEQLADLELAAEPDLARLRDAMLSGENWQTQLYNGLAAAAEAVLLPAIGVGLIPRERAAAEARRLLRGIDAGSL